jgi:hypothetical protein
MTKEKAALVWHLADLALAVIGVSWSVYHLMRRRAALIELPPRR